MSWRHVDLFSGIGGFALAAANAGFETVAFCEIDPPAAKVLRARFPGVPVVGDVRSDEGWPAGPVRVLTAGFPCQDVSVAGKRAGLAGARTGLFWEILRVAERTDPDFLLLENVPGLVSQGGGRDLATVVGALVGADLDVPDGGWGGSGVACGPAGVAAWRILDAEYFRLAQRRRRWFCLVDRRARGARALEILLEPAGVRGDTDAGGAPREGAPAGAEAGLGGPGGRVVPALTSKMAKGTGGPAGDEVQNIVATPICEITAGKGAKRDGGVGKEGDPMFTLEAKHRHAVVTVPLTVRPHADNKSQETKIVLEPQPFGFDAAQVTSKANGSVPHAGKVPALAAGGKAMVARDPLVVDMGGGKGHAGVSRDRAPTLSTNEPHAVFAPRAFLEAEGETDDQVGADVAGALDADGAGAGPHGGGPEGGDPLPALGEGVARDPGPLDPAGARGGDGQRLFLAPLPEALPGPPDEPGVLGAEVPGQRPEGSPGLAGAPQIGLFGPDLVDPRAARPVRAPADADGPEAFDWQYNPESRGPVAGTLNVTRVPAVHGQEEPRVVPALHTNLQSNRADGAEDRVVLERGAEAFKAAHFTRGKDGAPAPVSPPLTADADRGDEDVVVFNSEQTPKASEGKALTMRAEHNGGKLNVSAPAAVPRRLTPRECERLQGFPDDWTALEGMADSPRYKALGNAVARPVVEWILRRIKARVEAEESAA